MGLEALAQLFNGGGFSKTVSSLQIAIQRVENGFIVTVEYPPHMLKSGPPVHVQKLMEGLARMAKQNEEGREVHPMDALQSMMSGMEAKEPKPLRKPVEEYVFPSLDQMLSFVKEAFSAEA